jgi:aryl-alcohol dehydrogenase-like predicted oxidoreductase
MTRINNYATPEGTKRYVDRVAMSAGIRGCHFRLFNGLYLSSIGLGTYLGDPVNDDSAFENAAYRSVKSGAVNVIDTAINYRNMKSEKNIGRALSHLISDRIISRDQVFISTKNGYIIHDADAPEKDIIEYMKKKFVSAGIVRLEEIKPPYHILNPNYIRRCIDISLANMNLDTIDLLYIHNAWESWSNYIGREEFMQMLSKVFEVYEEYRLRNKICYYGMATWTCFRVEPDNRKYLSLEEIVKLAEKIGGKKHGFKFIQLPYNLDYPEAYLLKNQVVDSEKVNILNAASKLNVGIFTSAPFLHGHLLGAQVPNYSGLTNQVDKIIHIIRSSPSVIASLIGQKKAEHLEQNLNTAKICPMEKEDFVKDAQILFREQPPLNYLRTTLSKDEESKLAELKKGGLPDTKALAVLKILNPPHVCVLCGNTYGWVKERLKNRTFLEHIEEDVKKDVMEDHPEI